jgi:MFS family permease
MHQKYIYQNSYVIEDIDLFNSIVSGLIPFGAIFGSQIINPIAVKGRRKALIIISITFMIGVAITLIFNMFALMLGRLIMGLCVGAYVTVCPLFISETCPPSLSGPLGSFNQMGAVTGIFSAFTVPFLMPLPEDIGAEYSGRWRIAFGLPFIFGLLQLLLFLFVFKYDTPKFYKDKGDYENLDNVLKKIYMTGSTESIAIVQRGARQSEDNDGGIPGFDEIKEEGSYKSAKSNGVNRSE